MPNQNSSPPLAVPYNLLISIYIIIPICIFVQIIDTLFFDNYLVSFLPNSPQQYFILSLIFGTPHIIASNIIMFSNKEYRKHYGPSILIVTILIALFYGIGSQTISPLIMFAIITTATIYHVLKQSFGIGNMSSRLSGWQYELWCYSGIVIGSVVYILIFIGQSLSPEVQSFLSNIIWVTSALFTILSIKCLLNIKNSQGKVIFIANALMVLFTVYFYINKYYFFAAICPRFVHDISAFIFYVAHDYNKHNNKPQNILYKAVSSVKLNGFVIVPGVAILLTYFVTQYGDQLFSLFTQNVIGMTIPGAISFGFVGYLGLMHYYFEGKTWKSGSPYRANLAIKFN